MSTNKIRQLSTLIANQIAAGEVITRPLSVVKECLENSLDAGASEVNIEISFGGLNNITISDNGEGILPDDMPLAVLAHATSKIHNLSDLNAISSLGFRGEALASIAAISKFTLCSRVRGYDEGKKITVIDENVQLMSCGHNFGTTVIVNDLFYNTPVRKKFLGSARTEFLGIDKLVRCFALSAPEIKISFKHQGKSILELSPGTTAEREVVRLKKILGKAFMDSAINFEANHIDLKIKGWIARPDYARSQQDRMWVYVNRRMVNDKLLNHAVKQAFQDKIHPGRYPVCVIYIEIDPQEVDVNVHPTKHELRFHQPRLVHDALRSTIEKHLVVENNIALEENKSINQSLELFATPGAKDVLVHNWQYSNWINLNANFVLIKQETGLFLLHVKRFQEIYLREQLKNMPLPFASRHLLVPISIAISNDLDKLEASFELFAEIGITLSWLTENTLLIRTIPLITPNLDLKGFILKVLSYKIQDITKPVILQELIKHSSIDTLAISDIEKEKWGDYLAKKNNVCNNYLKALTIETLELFFHV